MDLQERARQAKLILDNQMFQSAFKDLKSIYIDAMVSSEMKDIEKREHLYRCVHALEDIKNYLTAMIEEGTLDLLMVEKQKKAKI